jgi:hypothetical protein
MTAQIHEGLILDGEQTSMACTPSLPHRHPRITSGDPALTRYASTACARGYKGTWKIEDGRFYLVGLEGRWQLAGDEPLFAEWYSGTLRIPRGKLVSYVHGGFASQYEQDLLVRVEKGRVLSRKVQSNRAPAPAVLFGAFVCVVLLASALLAFALRRH